MQLIGGVLIVAGGMSQVYFSTKGADSKKEAPVLTKI